MEPCGLGRRACEDFPAHRIGIGYHPFHVIEVGKGNVEVAGKGNMTDLDIRPRSVAG